MLGHVYRSIDVSSQLDDEKLDIRRAPEYLTFPLDIEKILGDVVVNQEERQPQFLSC